MSVSIFAPHGLSTYVYLPFYIHNCFHAKLNFYTNKIVYVDFMGFWKCNVLSVIWEIKLFFVCHITAAMKVSLFCSVHANQNLSFLWYISHPIWFSYTRVFTRLFNIELCSLLIIFNFNIFSVYLIITGNENALGLNSAFIVDKN